MRRMTQREIFAAGGAGHALPHLEALGLCYHCAIAGVWFETAADVEACTWVRQTDDRLFRVIRTGALLLSPHMPVTLQATEPLERASILSLLTPAVMMGGQPPPSGEAVFEELKFRVTDFFRWFRPWSLTDAALPPQVTVWRRGAAV